MAITWRTVAGGGGGQGVALAQSGTAGVMQSIDALRRLAADQQKMAIQNDQAITQKNTEDYLDRVAQVTSAADLSNPETQAQLMQLRAGYGQMIDRAATRNAIQDRQLNLIKAETAANTFADQEQERAQRPLMEQAIQLSRSGDLAGANKILADNSFINEGALAAQVDQNADRVTQRLYAAEGQARAQRAESRAIAADARSAEQFKMMREDRQEQRQLRKDTNFLNAAELELKSGEAALRASNPMANTSTDPLADSNKLIAKYADKIEPWFSVNANTIDTLTNKTAALMKDGIDLKGEIGKVKIPEAILDQYFAQAQDRVFRSTDSYVADMEDWLKTYATTNPGLFRNAAQINGEIQKLREAQKEVNSGKLSVLRGNKLDATGLSDKIQTIRNRIPTDNR